MKSEEKVYSGLNYQNAGRGRQSRLSESNSDEIDEEKDAESDYSAMKAGHRTPRVEVGKADCPNAIRTQSTKKKRGTWC